VGNAKQRIYANHKCSLNRAQVDAYLAGKPIFPRTVEMDLTNRCTRACPTCPSAGSRMPAHVLTPDFVDDVLGVLEGETRGIIFSGGEPTFSPYFVDILGIACKRGFTEVAVVTNGTELGRRDIQDALMTHATTIRVSLYDWYDSDTPAPTFFKQLERVTGLRKRIDREGSKLEIGLAMLTSRKRLPRMLNAVKHAAAAGAHWLYFHPMCERWAEGQPVQENQEGVLEALEALQQGAGSGARIHVPVERYSRYPLYFSAFHAAHFLIQIGADGVNYASPESKYHPSCALADLHGYRGDDFLWRPRRIAAIEALNSDRYRFAGTRHRGAMFSDFLEGYIRGRTKEVVALRTASEKDFLYPHLS